MAEKAKISAAVLSSTDLKIQDGKVTLSIKWAVALVLLVLGGGGGAGVNALMRGEPPVIADSSQVNDAVSAAIAPVMQTIEKHMTLDAKDSGTISSRLGFAEKQGSRNAGKVSDLRGAVSVLEEEWDLMHDAQIQMNGDVKHVQKTLDEVKATVTANTRVLNQIVGKLEAMGEHHHE